MRKKQNFLFGRWKTQLDYYAASSEILRMNLDNGGLGITDKKLLIYGGDLRNQRENFLKNPKI